MITFELFTLWANDDGCWWIVVADVNERAALLRLEHIRGHRFVWDFLWLRPVYLWLKERMGK
jgi:hypothetical protein